MLKIAPAAFALLLVAGSVLAEPVDLRGPAPEAGRTVVSTIESETDTGTLNMMIQGQPIQGTMSTKSSYEVMTKIAQVSEGSPNKVNLKFVKAKTLNVMNFLGQEQKQEDASMQGVELEQVKGEEGWKTEVKAGNLPAEAKEIIQKAGYVDQRTAYPDKPVAVGEAWKITGEQIAAFMGQGGMPGMSFEGSVDCKLAEIKVVDGVQTAFVPYKLDGTMKLEMDQQGMKMTMSIKMKGEGTLERNLADFTTASSFAGDMIMDMAMTANGQPMMTTNASMPVRTAAVEKLQK